MRKYIIFTVILLLVISIGYLLYNKFERPFPKLSMNQINEITVISYWPGADGNSQEIKVGQSVKEKIIREFNTLTRSDITAVIGTPEYYIDIVLKNGDKVLLFENSKETVTVSVYRGDKRELEINGVSKELAGYVNRLGDRFRQGNFNVEW